MGSAKVSWGTAGWRSLLVGVPLVSLLAARRSDADNRVLIIGIDGAGGSFVEQADTPHLDTLSAAGTVRYDFLNEGSLTPNAPGAYGASGVNWSTILTGVAAPTHGVSDNSFAGSQFATWPSMFHYLRQANPTAYTASLSHWEPINTYVVDNADVDLEIGGVSDDEIRDAAVALLDSGNPTALFLHFDQVDHAGHSFGWGSSEYFTALEAVDTLVGDVAAALNARPSVIAGEEDWLVLVTADHGGEGFGHFASQGPINWHVPMIVSGPSVEDASTMQQGTLRDVASTALWHLGIDPFDLGLEGTIRGLTITPPSGVAGDINGDGLLAGDGTGLAATDDVTAFLENWLVTAGGSMEDRYGRGDLNLDGITDLSDWALLNRLDPAMGTAVGRLLGGQVVPEPACNCLLLTAFFGILTRKSRRR